MVNLLTSVADKRAAMATQIFRNVHPTSSPCRHHFELNLTVNAPIAVGSRTKDLLRLSRILKASPTKTNSLLSLSSKNADEASDVMSPKISNLRLNFCAASFALARTSPLKSILGG
jgi:hypothetical protein